MKRIITILFFLAAIVTTTHAYDFMVDGLCYNYNDDGVSVTLTYQNSLEGGYLNLNGDLIIQQSVLHEGKSYTVTAIDFAAFRNCKNLTSVTIPYGLTSIGDIAFQYCTGLTSVFFSNSVTTIGGGAFYGCTSLTSVSIPSSTTSIGISTFLDCSSLSSIIVDEDNNKYDSRDNCNAIIDTETNNLMIGCKNTTIPNTVTSIGEQSFMYCGLTTLNIPNSVKTIGMQAFSNCSNLTSVTIPNSVTMIGIQAFRNCHGLKSVTVGNSVTEISDGAFEYCNSLTSLTIGNSVTRIGELAFASCSEISGTLTIPNSVTEIGKGAFYNCSKLNSVIIGNSVTTICMQAFYGCRDISVYMPQSVTTIGEKAFSQCNSLVIYNKRKEPITIPNDVFEYTYSVYLYVPLGSSNNYQNTNVWNNFNIIEYDYNTNFMFDGLCYRINNNKAVVTYQIPNNYGASYIKLNGELNIPSIVTHNESSYSVTDIDENAFHNCYGINSVIIPNTVSSIGKNSFNHCSYITTLYIPSSVNYIGNGAFNDCNALTAVNITDLSAWCNIDFNFGGSNNPLYYAHHLYLNGTEIKNLIIPDDVFMIKPSAFYGCTGLNSVIIPNSVIDIGNSTFYDCSGLTSVSFGNSLTKISEYSFSGCTKLTSVTIPSSVTSIDNNAFRSCTSLIKVKIPNSVTSIGSCAFSNCTSLTTVNIPSSVTLINNGAFECCSGLTSVTIPNSVTQIDEEAFSGCTGLKYIYCNIIEPLNISSNVFENVNKPSCTLYVPIGSGEAYHNANVWKDFNIVEYDFSGIDTIINDDVMIGVDGLNIVVKGVANPKTTIYDLNGRTIYQGSQAIITIPQHGIYIIDVNGKKSKILI